MIRYLARRLLLFIPTLFIISLLAFIISVNAPGDPVERMVSLSASDGQGQAGQNESEQRSYWRKKLGLDLPVFYFSLRPLSEPEVLQNIFDPVEKKSLQQLSRATGNPETTIAMHQARISLLDVVSSQGDSLPDELFADVHSLKYAASADEISNRLRRIHAALDTSGTKKLQLLKQLKNTEAKFIDYKLKTAAFRNYIPVLAFNSSNQYHRWVFGDGNWLTGAGAVNSKGIIRGDFGLSYLNRQPVSDVIAEKVGWSLFFALVSVLIAYLVSIPIGVWAGARKDSKFDHISSVTLFILYSLPSFWFATLLMMTFANPDVFHWFPASGIKPVTGYPDGAGMIEKLRLSLPYMILPMICYSYSSFAFLSRTLRVAVLENMSQEYIRTAMAKGLSFRLVVFRHAFRNSLLPLITVFANVFPMAIGGSVILETIFTIPGMGFESVHSIQNQNYPMIVAIFTITGMLTMTGYLVSDILYAFADPRITFDKR
jgi:peptide/nickel transport system permease protein